MSLIFFSSYFTRSLINSELGKDGNKINRVPVLGVLPATRTRMHCVMCAPRGFDVSKNLLPVEQGGICLASSWGVTVGTDDEGESRAAALEEESE